MALLWFEAQMNPAVLDLINLSEFNGIQVSLFPSLLEFVDVGLNLQHFNQLQIVCCDSIADNLTKLTHILHCNIPITQYSHTSLHLLRRLAAPNSPHPPPPLYKFYNQGEPLYELSNFYNEEFIYNNAVWQCAEICFQAAKFPINSPAFRLISESNNARNAFNFARKYDAHKDERWFAKNIGVMEVLQME